MLSMMQLLKNGDKAGLFEELGKLQSGSEENIYLDALEQQELRHLPICIYRLEPRWSG